MFQNPSPVCNTGATADDSTVVTLALIKLTDPRFKMEFFVVVGRHVTIVASSFLVLSFSFLYRWLLVLFSAKILFCLLSLRTVDITQYRRCTNLFEIFDGFILINFFLSVLADLLLRLTLFAKKCNKLNEKSARRRRKNCALAVVRRSQKFRPAANPFPGAWDGQNLISWRWSLPLPTNPVWFGEDRCTQFRVIVVTDPQTHTHTHTRTQTHI